MWASHTMSGKVSANYRSLVVHLILMLRLLNQCFFHSITENWLHKCHLLWLTVIECRSPDTNLSISPLVLLAWVLWTERSLFKKLHMLFPQLKYICFLKSASAFHLLRLILPRPQNAEPNSFLCYAAVDQGDIEKRKIITKMKPTQSFISHLQPPSLYKVSIMPGNRWFSIFPQGGCHRPLSSDTPTGGGSQNAHLHKKCFGHWVSRPCPPWKPAILVWLPSESSAPRRVGVTN